MCAESVRGVLLADKVNEIFFKKILKQEKSLQARGNYSKNLHHFIRLHTWLTRASLTLSAYAKGVVTIEASIAIPVFLFCFHIVPRFYTTKLSFNTSAIIITTTIARAPSICIIRIFQTLEKN